MDGLRYRSVLVLGWVLILICDFFMGVLLAAPERSSDLGFVHIMTRFWIRIGPAVRVVVLPWSSTGLVRFMTRIPHNA